MPFTDKEKHSCFDKIAALYFCQNFGSTSKADLEVLLFSEYLEHCINAGEPFDDYALSKQLGITQSRIRSLKERKELKYPHAGFNWRESFAKSVINAKYDEKDHHIKFIIDDINVMNEVRHYIEKMGWYDECSLNKRLLNIPLDCFIEICFSDENCDIQSLFSEETKQKIKQHKSDPTVLKLIKDFSKNGLKSFLMSAGKEVILDVIQLLPFGGIAKTAFDFLGKAIKGV